jgi:hypothetical protein
MRIEVTRHDNPDPKKALRREVWTFDQIDHLRQALTMRLCEYVVETRKSTRHRVWDVEGAWPRGHTFKQLSQPESVPDDVVAEVKQRIMDGFTVQIGWPR